MSPDPKNYASINVSRKHRHSTKGHVHKRGFPRPNKLEALRLAIFTLVLTTSLIALALAAHFLTVLQANDLTHFVPFALFTSVASMIGMIALMGVVLVHKSKPIALKVELLIIAVIGIFWLSLSIFVSTSPAESAEVQCFSDDGDLLPDDEDPFDTDIYHAQYRVLTAIGSMNAFILLILCAVLAFMALRHFNRTRDWVSTTRKPLLGEKTRSKSRERSQSRSKSKRSPLTLTDLPKRVARKAFGLAGVGDVYTDTKDNVNSSYANGNANMKPKMKEKEKTGLPLPATARGATTTRPTNATAKNTSGTRPPPPTPIGRGSAAVAQTPPVPTPPIREPKRPPITKSKSLPNPSRMPVRDRPSASPPNANATSKNLPLTPPPKARIGGGTAGINSGKISPPKQGSPKQSSSQAVVRRKTNA